MPHVARKVVPGLPHHVTQRGNRRQLVFFNEGDYVLYRHLMAEHRLLENVSLWAYCLMPNHIHLILTPETETALSSAVGQAHRRYTTAINRREGWTGNLWQGRYGSAPLVDDAAVLAAARYIERNPVEAGLVKRPEDWIWSSARAHLSGAADMLLSDDKLPAIAGNWAQFMELGT
jgi:putative transposase